MRRRLAQLGGTTSLGECRAVLALLLRPSRLVHGEALAEYERAFAETVGVRHAVSFAHGRTGFYALLRALGVGPGDEVIVPTPTHIVVANAVRHAGAEPVFADSDPATYCVDLEMAERVVSPRTRVLVLQHTFGNPCDFEAAERLAERHGLAIIEDCVHALGSRYRGRSIGSLGRAAFFSTEETKTISTTMGGMVVTDDAELAAGVRAVQDAADPPSARLVAQYLVKLFLYYFLTQPHVHVWTRPVYEFLGRRNPLPGPTTPAERAGQTSELELRRLGNGQAVVGLRQLQRLDANVAHRRAISRMYDALLADRLSAGVTTLDGADPALVRYPVRVADRAGVVRALSRHLVVGEWFTSVLEEADSPADGGYVVGSCPRAEEASQHLINLPTHERVTAEDADRIAAALLAATGA